MNSRFKFIFIAVFLLSGETLSAQWDVCIPSPKEAERALELISEGHNGNSRRYNMWEPAGRDEHLVEMLQSLMMVWGWAQSWHYRNGRLLPPGVNDEELLISHPLFEKPLPVRAVLQRDERGRIRRAPVVFIFEGIGTGVKNYYCQPNLTRFASRGYHAITIPSPMSADSIQSRPRRLPGIPAVDAKAHLESIRAILAKIEPSNAESVHLFGMSYGAFLGAVISALDAESATPIITGHRLFISPPERIGDAYQFADEGIDRHKDQIRKIPRLLPLGRQLRLVSAKKPHDLTDSDLNDATTLTHLLGGFGTILPATEAILKFRPEFRGKIATDETLRFRDFVQVFHGSSLAELNNENGQYLYWTDRAEHAGASVITLSSNDDPMFTGQTDPSRFRSFLTFAFTGHAGVRFLPIYDLVLDSVFGFPLPGKGSARDNLRLSRHETERLIAEANRLSDSGNHGTYCMIPTGAAERRLNALREIADRYSELERLAGEIVSRWEIVDRDESDEVIKPVSDHSIARRYLEWEAEYLRVRRDLSELRKSDSRIVEDRWADGGRGHFNRQIERYESLIEKPRPKDAPLAAFYRLQRIALAPDSSVRREIARVAGSVETGFLPTLAEIDHGTPVASSEEPLIHAVAR